MRGINLDENQEAMDALFFSKTAPSSVFENIKGSEISFRKFLKAQLHMQKRKKSNRVSSREGKFCCTQESDIPGRPLRNCSRMLRLESDPPGEKS
jgi:hypothetical protein